MKQNKYFSPGRFAHLLRNDLLINQKTYLFTVIGLSIVLYLITTLVMNNNTFTQNQQYIPLLMFYLMAVGAAIGTSFPALKDQIRTSNYLLTPGSTLEKFAVQFLVRVILFIPIALFLFWLIMILAKASVWPNPEKGIIPSQIVDFSYSDIFKEVHKFRDKFVIVMTIFSLATFLFAGSAFFKRFALVKTLIVFGIMVFLVVLSFVIFSHIFYPAETHGFNVHLESYKIAEDLSNTQLAAYLLGCLSCLFFLPLAYFKLKEKEV